MRIGQALDTASGICADALKNTATDYFAINHRRIKSLPVLPFADTLGDSIMQPRSTIAAACVDLEGFEPSASSVRLKRAPNCATGPQQVGYSTPVFFHVSSKGDSAFPA
jgi:hypothetical protein